MTLLHVRTIVSLLACAMVVACTSSTVGVPPAPAPHVTLTKTQQALEVDAALTVTNGIRFASVFAAVAGALVPPQATPSAQAAPICVNGVEKQITFPTPQTIDAIVNIFYDPACRHPRGKSHFVATLTSRSTADLVGTMKLFDRAGKTIAYGSIAGKSRFTSSSRNTVLTGSISRTPAGSPIMSFGLDCTLSSSKPNSCGFGAVNSLLSKSTAIGVTASLDGFVGSGASKGTVSLNGFEGPRGTLKLSKGAGHTWKVSGGKLVATEDGTFSERVDAQRLAVDLDLQLADRLGDANVRGRLGSLGTLGTVTQRSNGLKAATYSTLSDGTGTIVYSDGTTGSIVFFIVV